MKELNVLTLAHLHKIHAKYNRIFEDWCEGIRANSGKYHFMDYLELYSEAGKKIFEKKVERFIEEKEIDCVFIAFYSGDLTLDINFLERLSKKVFLVMGFFDTEHYFEAVDRYYAQAADLVLLPDYLSKFKYELLGINAMCTFSLFNKDYYRRLDDADKNIDVSFVGDITRGNRGEYIDYLRNNKVPVKCYGANTENGLIDFDKMVEVFNRSKININFTGMIDGASLILGSQINNRIKQSKGRPIEAALCGGFVLTEYSPGVENMFEIGKEIDVFHTKEELSKKIQYYLENGQEREEIARRGYERALRDYDSHAGIAKIFDVIGKSRKIEPVIYLDDDFMENYTSYRFLYITRFVIKVKIKSLFEELKIVIRNKRISLSKAKSYVLKEVLEKLTYYLIRYPNLRKILKAVFRIKIKS